MGNSDTHCVLSTAVGKGTRIGPDVLIERNGIGGAQSFKEA